MISTKVRSHVCAHVCDYRAAPRCHCPSGSTGETETGQWVCVVPAEKHETTDQISHSPRCNPAWHTSAINCFCTSCLGIWGRPPGVRDLQDIQTLHCLGQVRHMLPTTHVWLPRHGPCVASVDLPPPWTILQDCLGHATSAASWDAEGKYRF